MDWREWRYWESVLWIIWKFILYFQPHSRSNGVSTEKNSHKSVTRNEWILESTVYIGRDYGSPSLNCWPKTIIWTLNLMITNHELRVKWYVYISNLTSSWRTKIIHVRSSSRYLNGQRHKPHQVKNKH